LHHEEQDTALMTEIRENFFKAGLITTTVSISYEPKCKQQENKRKKNFFMFPAIDLDSIACCVALFSSISFLNDVAFC